MKKYKLIKTYPGSPKLETIVKVESDGYIHWNVNSNKNNPTNYIHGSSMKQYEEFWEEVIVKDYEILSFTYKQWGEKIVKLLSDGTYYFSPSKEQGWKLKDLLHKGYCVDSGHIKIHSIKRLSDGEIFTCDDNTNGGIIKSISIVGSTLEFKVNGSCFLDGLVKLKEPLLTTEDGVDIFEGDVYHVVNSYNLQYCSTQSHGHNSKIPYKTFSTKEAAEEYILMNKPCNLSISDIFKVLVVYGSKETNLEKIIKLVKSKTS